MGVTGWDDDEAGSIAALMSSSATMRMVPARLHLPRHRTVITGDTHPQSFVSHRNGIVLLLEISVADHRTGSGERRADSFLDAPK
jgi:hypothetical protein